MDRLALIAALWISVTLAWDPNVEPDIAGYKLHYGWSSGVYEITVDVGSVTTYQLTGLECNDLYRIAATAYDTYDNESDFSNEVVFQMPCDLEEAFIVREP
jgi:hypothetical protein